MDQKPQLGLGEYLRGEREKRHITIEQVASATKINIKLLHALESDNYDSLPAKPFVRGFVTSYTRYVGLDHREVLARFDIFLNEKSGQKFKRPENAPHIFVEREGQRENNKTALTVVMVTFLVAAVAVFALKPSLRHHHSHGKDKAAVTNDEIVTVMPPPGDGSPITVKPIAPAKAEPAANVAEAPVVEAPIPPAPVKPEPKVEAKPTPKLEAKTKAKDKDKKDKEKLKAETKSKRETKPDAEETEAAGTTATPVTATATTEATPGTQEPTKATASPTPVTYVKIPPIPNGEVRYRLVVRALDDAWVKYQVDDRPIQQYTLKKDKVIWVRARTSLRFTSAKPGALEISYDNRDFKPLGSAAKTIIVPKDAEEQYKATPFVDPNPAYLSTPNR